MKPMIEKFDKNNKNFEHSQDDDLGSLDQEAMLGDNYAANLDKDDKELYSVPKSHRHIKLWSFLILVVFILFISGSRFYDNIIDPLKYDVPEGLDPLYPEEDAAQTIAELKKSDTDQDGLTDYQEIYQYYTSIFLPDTDSDGFTDAEEIALGEDPLCPIDQSCNLLRLITPNTKLASIVEGITLDPDLTVQQATTVEFRKFLADGGMSAEELATLSDKDLLAIFKIVEENNVFESRELNASTTPDEIREFLLLLPGTDLSEINAMSDEELILVAEDLIAQ